MKKIIIAFLAIVLIASCNYKRDSDHQQSEYQIDNLPASVKLINTTPIKDQGESELCWAYGMLATIESEHIMKGDSVNLSVAYVARMMLQEQALEYYFAQGKKDISLRGTASMLIHYIDKYGAQPYDSYEDPKHVNYKVLCRKVQKLCDSAISQKTGIDKLKEDLNNLFDAEIGYMPAKAVHMLGAEYTPQEFAHSVCYPEEYVSLTSFSHHPFREYFALEVPDNRMHDAFLNLPLDEMMLHIQKAVEKGHPVCWEGDISEPGFQTPKKNYVDVRPAERPVTQLSRQKEFEQLRTTDDHVMEIIGSFVEGKQRYYVCRNSWGKKWGNKGLIYLSEDRHRGDPEEALRVQGRRDNRGAPHARPCAHAAGDTAEVQRVERDGLSEGQELAHDLRQARQPEVQVRQQEVLGGGLLRLDGRPERGHHREIHQGAGGCRHRAGQVERQGILRPVQEIGTRPAGSTGSPRVKGNLA